MVLYNKSLSLSYVVIGNHFSFSNYLINFSISHTSFEAQTTAIRGITCNLYHIISLPLQKNVFSFLQIRMNFIMMKTCFNNQIFQASNDSNADCLILSGFQNVLKNEQHIFRSLQKRFQVDGMIFYLQMEKMPKSKQFSKCIAQQRQEHMKELLH